MIRCLCGFLLRKICDDFGRGIVGLDGRRDARYFFYDIFFCRVGKSFVCMDGGMGRGDAVVG